MRADDRDNSRPLSKDMPRPSATTKSESLNPKSEANSNEQKQQIQNRILRMQIFDNKALTAF